MKVFILLANGFEDIEMIAAVDILRRAGADVKLLSIDDNLVVTSAHNVKVTADGLLKDYRDHAADVVITPGGIPGATNLRDSAIVKDMLRRQADEDRYIASICASPIALESADVINNRQFTCYPSFETQISSGVHKAERLVVDGKLITAMGPGVAFEFGLKIVELTIGADVAKQLHEGMIIA